MTDFGYTRLTPEHVRHLKEIVGPDRFVEGSKLLEHYNIDWTHKYKGASRLALLPTTVDQISQIMKYCNMHRIAVVPQGGNTGLVGGATPIDDEVILSTEKMQTIRGFNEVSSIVSLEAGVILETANQYLRERGHMMPVDFGAKGSCTVGGILATNAAGLRFIRYGGMQSAIVGIEAVTADGCIIDSMNTCLKDNTGFPLRNLIVGSEGTLCIITAANIRVPIAPKSVNLLHASLESVESLLCIFLEARNSLSEILSAFEFWDAQSQELLDTYLNIKEPTVKESKFYVLIETNGSCDETDSLRAVAFMKKIMDKNRKLTESTLAFINCLNHNADNLSFQFFVNSPQLKHNYGTKMN